MGRPNARVHPFLNSKVVKNLTCRQRCSPRRIVECIRVASDDRKSLLKSLGLDRFIDIQLTSIEIKVVSWIIQNYNYENHSITLHDGKVHKLVLKDVQLVYGLPRGRIDVPSLEDVTRDTTDSLAAELHLVPDPDYYSLNSIKNALDVVESDIDWLRLFVVYIFGCLFCPSSNTHVDLRYLAFVSSEHMLKFKTYNWCKFVLEKFKENMAESKDCSYMKADFYFLIVAFLLNESKLVGGESVLHSVTNKSVIDFFNNIIGDYCRVNKILPNDSDDEDDKVPVKKKKKVAEYVKLKALIKADIKKKQKGNVSVEKKHVSKVDVKKRRPVGKKYVSMADSKKRMDKEVDAVQKKLVTKVDTKRKRTTDSRDKKAVNGEVDGDRTKRKKVDAESGVGLGKNNIVLPSAGIFWSDVKDIPEAVSLLDTIVEARNSCTGLIKDYNGAVSALENFIKNLKDSEEGSKPVKEDGAEHDKKEEEKSVEGDGAENEKKEDQKSAHEDGAELDTKDEEKSVKGNGAENEKKEDQKSGAELDTKDKEGAEQAEEKAEEEEEKGAAEEKDEGDDDDDKKKERGKEKDEGDGDDHDSWGQGHGLTVGEGVEDADGYNEEQKKEEPESKEEAGYQQQGGEGGAIDSDVSFGDKGGLASVGLTGLMDTVHSINAEYIEEQAGEKEEEEKDEGDDDDDKKKGGKEKDEGDGDHHDSVVLGDSLTVCEGVEDVDGNNEEQKKEEPESKEAGYQQQGGQGAANDSDVIGDKGGLAEVGLTGLMDTVHSIKTEYIEEQAEEKAEEEKDEADDDDDKNKEEKEKNDRDGDDHDSVEQGGLTVGEGVEDADGNNKEQKKEEPESKAGLGHQQQWGEGAIDSDVMFGDKGGLAEVGLTGLMATVHSIKTEYIEEQAEEQAEEEKDEADDDDDEKKGGKGIDEGDGDDHDSGGEGGGLAVGAGVEDADGNNEEQKKEESESKEEAGQQQGGQGAAIDSDVIFCGIGGLEEVGLTGLMDTIHGINSEYIEDNDMEDLPKSPVHVGIGIASISSPLDKLVNAVQLKNIGGSSQSLVVPDSINLPLNPSSGFLDRSRN